MAIQQHGISRSRPDPRRESLSGKEDARSQASDIRSLSRAIDTMNDHMNRVEDRLVRRINEMILSGTLAQRPAAGVADRIFFTTDELRTYFDTGLVWVGAGGSVVFSTTLSLGDRTVTLSVGMLAATYGVSVLTNWNTGVWYTTKTAATLVLRFSVQAPTGGVVVVTVFP